MLLIPMQAREIAALHSPRLQTDAQEFWCDWISREVTAGNFVVTPKDGEWIHTNGMTLEEYLEHWLKSRPHAYVPVQLQDPTDDLWTCVPANITRRGARLRALREFCGSDAAALVLLKEEAAGFGITNPLSTEIGEKIDPKATKKLAGHNRDNPYNPAPRGGEQARTDRIIKLVSNPAGAKIAPSLARSAKPPCRIDGSPL
jgi:hypothetical protein